MNDLVPQTQHRFEIYLQNPTNVALQVAEVRSRFEGEDGGVKRFLEITRRLGFDTKQMDRSNKMFLMAEFKKSARAPEKNVEFKAKVMN